MKTKRWFFFKKKNSKNYTAFESSRSMDYLLKNLKRGYELEGPFESLFKGWVKTNKINK